MLFNHFVYHFTCIYNIFFLDTLTTMWLRHCCSDWGAGVRYGADLEVGILHIDPSMNMGAEIQLKLI